MMQPNAEERKDSNDEDDFFGSQDADQVSELQRREREVEALRRPHYTTGVREGASAAHEAHVQHGFDVGFAEGAKAVTKPAFLLGACSVLSQFYEKNGCSSESADTSQKLGDSEVPTANLRDLKRVISRLSNELQAVPLDGEIAVDDAVFAIAKVSLLEVPDSILHTASPQHTGVIDSDTSDLAQQD